MRLIRVDQDVISCGCVVLLAGSNERLWRLSLAYSTAVCKRSRSATPSGPRRGGRVHHEHGPHPAMRLTPSHARAFSIDMTQVGDAWMPILCSRPVHMIPLRDPSGLNLGTMNALIPLMPLGASGRREDEVDDVLGGCFEEIKSWCHHKVMVFGESPSASTRGRFRIRFVKHIVPVHSPDQLGE